MQISSAQYIIIMLESNFFLFIIDGWIGSVKCVSFVFERVSKRWLLYVKVNTKKSFSFVPESFVLDLARGVHTNIYVGVLDETTVGTTLDLWVFELEYYKECIVCFGNWFGVIVEPANVWYRISYPIYLQGALKKTN